MVRDRKNVQKITIHPPLIRNYGVFSLVTHPFWHLCMAEFLDDISSSRTVSPSLKMGSNIF